MEYKLQECKSFEYFFTYAGLEIGLEEIGNCKCSGNVLV